MAKLSTEMAKTVNCDGFREIITKLIRLVKWLLYCIRLCHVNKTRLSYFSRELDNKNTMQSKLFILFFSFYFMSLSSFSIKPSLSSSLVNFQRVLSKVVVCMLVSGIFMYRSKHLTCISKFDISFCITRQGHERRALPSYRRDLMP